MFKRAITFVLTLSMLFSGLMLTTAYASTVAANGSLSDGGRHFLIIRTDGSLWAWGNNNEGQLGDGTTADRTSGNPVKVMDNVKFVTTGSGYSLAITNDGALWAWGSNQYGKLGDGTVVDRYSPVKVLDNAVYASAGGSYSFAVKADGSLWAWGLNAMGNLGDGTWTNRHSPVRIRDNIATANVDSTSWAIGTDGSLWAWSVVPFIMMEFGNFNFGTTTPFKVMENVASVEFGLNCFFVVRPNGDLHGYGDNSFGQLGDGTGINRDEFTWITNNVASVTTYSATTFALRNDNSLWGWGDNSHLWYFSNELSRNGTSYSPIRLLDNVAKIVDTGGLSILLLKTDGSLWEYGWGGGTQIMDNIALTAPDPPSSWAVGQVNAAIAANLVPQSLQSKYTQATTRAEFCALAVALFETVTDHVITERTTFNDTNDINIQKMGGLGVVTGIGGGAFSPNAELTREQAAVILVRLIESMGKQLPLRASTFSDISQISEWAIDHVGKIQAVGVMGGIGNNVFAPKDTYTREQSIITIMRVYDFINK